MVAPFQNGTHYTLYGAEVRRITRTWQIGPRVGLHGIAKRAVSPMWVTFAGVLAVFIRDPRGLDNGQREGPPMLLRGGKQNARHRLKIRQNDGPHYATFRYRAAPAPKRADICASSTSYPCMAESACIRWDS